MKVGGVLSLGKWKIFHSVLFLLQVLLKHWTNEYKLFTAINALLTLLNLLFMLSLEILFQVDPHELKIIRLQNWRKLLLIKVVKLTHL